MWTLPWGGPEAPSQGDRSLRDPLLSWKGTSVLLLPHSFIYLFITQSVNKYVLRAYYVPGTVPSVRKVAKGNRPPCQGPSPPSVAWAPFSGSVSSDTKETKSQTNRLQT